MGGDMAAIGTAAKAERKSCGAAEYVSAVGASQRSLPPAV